MQKQNVIPPSVPPSTHTAGDIIIRYAGRDPSSKHEPLDLNNRPRWKKTCSPRDEVGARRLCSRNHHAYYQLGEQPEDRSYLSVARALLK